MDGKAERSKGTQSFFIHWDDSLGQRIQKWPELKRCSMREAGKGGYQHVQNWGSSLNPIDSPCDPGQIFHPNPGASAQGRVDEAKPEASYRFDSVAMKTQERAGKEE